jgi:hypothetical protein
MRGRLYFYFYFFTGEILPIREIKHSKIRNKMIWRFSIVRSEKQNVKVARYIWFSGCSQNIDQNYISYLIYSQISLNFLCDLLSLFLHLCMDDSHLAIKQKFLKEAVRFRGEVE